MQEQPENPAQFLMNWLYAEKKNGNKTLVAENSRLRDELTKLKQREGQATNLFFPSHALRRSESI